MYFDYHVHSDFSNDSIYEMEEVVKDAIALKMSEICFTDHVDYGVKPDWEQAKSAQIECGKKKLNVNYPLYFKEIEKLQEKYRGKILIKKGLEFGIQSSTIPKFENLTQKYDLDFILLSIHQIGNLEFWNGAFQEGKTVEQSYQGYYEEMFQVIQQFHDYSVLAHMDLIRRYLDKKDYFHQNKEQIQKILRYIIEDGKGIEVNTSSFYYQIDGLTPSIDILHLYHQLGGKIITIGSDSHKKEQLGAHIHEIQAILRDIGYESICTFESMKPTFHRL